VLASRPERRWSSAAAPSTVGAVTALYLLRRLARGGGASALRPADFVSAGAMLRGIKKRVEAARARPVPAEPHEAAHFVDAGEPRLAEAEWDVVSDTRR
jgi:hypothetical protein